MFNGRNTLESVAHELIDGLEGGSIHLRPYESTGIDVDVEVFESMRKAMIEGYRRRAVALMAISLVLTIASIAFIIVATLRLALGNDLRTTLISETMIVSCFAGACAGFLSSFSVYGRASELMTYVRILRKVDPITARQLGLQVEP